MMRNWLTISALTVSLATPACLMTAGARAATPPSPAYVQERPWDQPPDEFRDVQKQGFRDGIEAAHRDFDQHRRKDADDHERYRHPPVDRGLRDDYRDGFRHGYEVAMRHMNEHHDHD